jgi:hypothetical protein
MVHDELLASSYDHIKTYRGFYTLTTMILKRHFYCTATVAAVTACLSNPCPLCNWATSYSGEAKSHDALRV